MNPSWLHDEMVEAQKKVRGHLEPHIPPRPFPALHPQLLQVHLLPASSPPLQPQALRQPLSLTPLLPHCFSCVI